jgi:hypothetical protein
MSPSLIEGSSQDSVPMMTSGRICAIDVWKMSFLQQTLHPWKKSREISGWLQVMTTHSLDRGWFQPTRDKLGRPRICAIDVWKMSFLLLSDWQLTTIILTFSVSFGNGRLLCFVILLLCSFDSFGDDAMKMKVSKRLIALYIMILLLTKWHYPEPNPDPRTPKFPCGVCQIPANPF